MAIGGGSLAGLARVSYEAVGLADFAADNQRAENIYRQSVSGMSDQAIRLELAQDSLRRSLQKGPAAFREQARAELALRRETEALTRSQDRQARGFASLRRGLVLYAGAIIGGAGIVQGMRTAISVASNLEEQQNKTRVTFRESGEEVIQWARSTSTTMGIASDQALQYASTLGGILNVSGLARDESARLSKQLVQLASDMASFNNASIEDTLEAIRAGLVGESEPLRRYQVLLSEARVKEAAFTQGITKSKKEMAESEKVLGRLSVILQDTADQQGDYARTADGLANSQRTLSALWREAQGLVGQALAPAFTDAVQGLRDWLSNAENQKTLQREINTIVGDGVTVVRALADVLGAARNAAAPLVEAVGGLGNAIRIMGAAWLAFKAKAVLGFAGTAAASRATSASMVRDAAVAGRAWDVATRPRVMPVGIVAGGGAGGLGRGALGMLGLTPAGAIVVGAAAATYAGLRSSRAPAISPQEFQRLREAAGRGEMTRADLQRLAPGLSDAQERELRRLIAVAQARGGGAASSPDSRSGMTRGGPAQDPPAPRGGRGDRFTLDAYEAQLERINERRIDAAATPGIADDVRAERAALALARRALRELDLTIDQRMQVKQERNRALQALASIEQAEEQEAARIREERQRKREEAARKAAERRKREEERMDKILDKAEKVAERRGELFQGIASRSGSRAGLRALSQRGVAKTLSELKAKEGKERQYTLAEIQRMQMEFLGGLQGIMNQFGSNIASPDAGAGQTATNTWVIGQLMREQNDQLARLTRTAQHPGAKMARNEFSYAYGGVGAI